MELAINIRKGIGDISFGMPVEEVVVVMGNADEVETIDNAADEPTTVLHYHELGLTLFCEGENPVLGCIDIGSEEATLFGRNIFDLTERQIVELMVANGYLEQDADQEDWGERRIGFPQGNVDFYFDDGELVSVVMGA